MLGPVSIRLRVAGRCCGASGSLAPRVAINGARVQARHKSDLDDEKYKDVIPGFPKDLFLSQWAEAGYSPLHLAAMQPSFPSFALDVLNGKPNEFKIPMVDWDAIVLRLLEHPKASEWLKHSKACRQDWPKGSPLALAVQHGHVRRARILLAAEPRGVQRLGIERPIVQYLIRGKYGYPRAEDWLPLGTVDKLGRNASEVLLLLLGAGVPIEPGSEATVSLLFDALQKHNQVPLRILLSARPELHDDLCLDKHGRRGPVGYALQGLAEHLIVAAPRFGGIVAGWPLPPETEEAARLSPHLHEKRDLWAVTYRGKGCRLELRMAVTALEALRDYRGWTPQQLEEEVRRFITDTKEKDKSFGRGPVGNLTVAALFHVNVPTNGPALKIPVPFATEVLEAARKVLPVAVPAFEAPLPTDEGEEAADEKEARADYDEETADAKAAADAKGAAERAAAREARAATRLERKTAREARYEARRNRARSLRYALGDLPLHLVPGLLDAMTTHVVTALRESYKKQTGYEYW